MQRFKCDNCSPRTRNLQQVRGGHIPRFAGGGVPGTEGCTSNARTLQVSPPLLQLLHAQQACVRHPCHQQQLRHMLSPTDTVDPSGNCPTPGGHLFTLFSRQSTCQREALTCSSPCCANLKVPQVRLSASYPASTHHPAIPNRAGGDHAWANHSPAIFRRVASVILIVPHPNFGRYFVLFTRPSFSSSALTSPLSLHTVSLFSAISPHT